MNKVLLFKTGKILLILSLFHLLNGCSLNSSRNNFPKSQDDLTKIWQLSDIDFNLEKDNDNIIDVNESFNSMLQEGILYSFFPDKMATKFIGEEYEPLTWEYDDQRHQLILFNRSVLDTLSIVDLETRKGKKYLKLEMPGMLIGDFLAIDEMLADFTQDPFYPINNEWRIKPDHEETDLELKKRLANYVQHVTLLLKAGIERDADVLSFKFSKGIIKIYRGGIGVINKVPNEWYSHFYSREQADKAIDLLRNYIRMTDYNGATSGSWIKDDYNILTVLYQTMDNDIKDIENSNDEPPPPAILE